MNRTHAAVIAAVLTVAALAPSSARAFSCSPANIDWGGAALLGGHEIGGPKLLYYLLACGTYPARVGDLVEKGKGGVIALPTELAKEADALTPGMHRVDYVYIRGGGPGRPIVVVPLTDGVTSFILQGRGQWTKPDVDALEFVFDRLPYEYLRHATSQFSDLVIYGGYHLCFEVPGIEQILELFGKKKCQRDDPTESGASGVALPIGFEALASKWVDAAGALVDGLPQPDPGTGPSTAPAWALDTFIHELGHFNQFDREWMWPAVFAFAGSYSGIAWHNHLFLGFIPIPFWFAHDGGTTDDSFVTNYAASAGDGPLEDYAETLTTAALSTQALRPAIEGDPSSQALLQDMQDAYTWWGGSRIYQRGFKRLFLATADPFAAKKAKMMTGIYTYSACAPQDADGDGVKWSPATGGDCDDTNPASTTVCPPPANVDVAACACPTGEVRDPAGVCVPMHRIDASVAQTVIEDASGSTISREASAEVCLDPDVTGANAPPKPIDEEGSCKLYRFDAPSKTTGGGANQPVPDLGQVDLWLNGTRRIPMSPATDGCYAASGLSAPLFQGYDGLEVQGTGGKSISRFEVSGWAPQPVKVETPSPLVAGKEYLVTAGAGGGRLTVDLLATDGTSGVTYEAHCVADPKTPASVTVGGRLTAAMHLDGATVMLRVQRQSFATATGTNAVTSLTATDEVLRTIK